jgi:hypothetical protein
VTWRALIVPPVVAWVSFWVSWIGDGIVRGFSEYDEDFLRHLMSIDYEHQTIWQGFATFVGFPFHETIGFYHDLWEGFTLFPRHPLEIGIIIVMTHTPAVIATVVLGVTFVFLSRHGKRTGDKTSFTQGPGRASTPR